MVPNPVQLFLVLVPGSLAPAVHFVNELRQSVHASLQAPALRRHVRNVRLYGLHPGAEHGVNVGALREVAGEAGQVPGPLALLAVGTGDGGVRHASGEMDIRDTVLPPHGGAALAAGLSRDDNISDQTLMAEYVSAWDALRLPRDLSAETTEQLHRIYEVIGPVPSELSPRIPGQHYCSEYIVPARVHTDG